MITLTNSAQEKIKELLVEENDPKLKLRIFVQGGGCSGMQYGFTFDNEFSDDDFQIQTETVSYVIDSMSSQYLQGAVIDWKEDLMGAGFSIDNPNSSTSCGCGSSFSVD